MELERGTMNNLTIAIDWDGVIHNFKQPKSGRRMGPPIEGARAAIEALYHAGHTLIIHTVWEEGRWPVIGDWLRYYEFPPIDRITNIKPNADIYLDDHGLKFTNWTDALSDINETFFLQGDR